MDWIKFDYHTFCGEKGRINGIFLENRNKGNNFKVFSCVYFPLCSRYCVRWTTPHVSTQKRNVRHSEFTKNFFKHKPVKPISKARPLIELTPINKWNIDFSLSLVLFSFRCFSIHFKNILIGLIVAELGRHFSISSLQIIHFE